jgi:hypothetical protein
MRRPTARLAMVAAKIWCGLPRRVRSTAIPLLILAGMTLTLTEVGAASITYNVLNYPNLQNGYTVTGTITTDGTIGQVLPGIDITSWDINILMGATTIATLTPPNSTNFSTTFDATPTTLSVGTPNDQVLFQSNSFALIWLSTPGFATYEALINDIPIWAAGLPSLASPIATTATVPEPPSAVLASIGAVVAFLAYGWSRHRRAQHRLKAD